MTPRPDGGGGAGRGGRPEPGGRFARPGRRLRFTARRATVLDARLVAPELLRVRVTGPELHDLESDGPSDHVRAFVPDPVTGDLVAPVAVGPEADGIVRPERPAHGRDLTPVAIDHTPAGVVLTLDIALHPEPGPLGAWARAAAPGAELVLVGPRGTKSAVRDAERILIVADATALPTAARWAREVPATTQVDVVVLDGPGGAGAAGYLATESGRPDLSVDIEPSVELVMARLRERGVGGDTYVTAAGEAGVMAEVRRWLKHELALPRTQYAVSGYWKRGVTAFDHHEPLDPSDPDD